MDLFKEDFTFLADILKEQAGMQLEPDKQYLVHTRLLPVAQQFNMRTVDQLIAALRLRNNPTLLQTVVEEMTTNESSFFRNQTPFKALYSAIIPKILAENPGKTSITIWSAGCSSGQEPYSIAMTLLEHKIPQLVEWRIIATDLTQKVLDKAIKGEYTQFEIQRGLPTPMLLKYFTQEKDRWYVKSTLKERIQFQKFNLLDSFVTLPTFDVIFCRNVLYYFETKIKENIVHKMAQRLVPYGALILGSSENMIGGSRGLIAFEEENAVYLRDPKVIL